MSAIPALLSMIQRQREQRAEAMGNLGAAFGAHMRNRELQTLRDQELARQTQVKSGLLSGAEGALSPEQQQAFMAAKDPEKFLSTLDHVEKIKASLGIKRAWGDVSEIFKQGRFPTKEEMLNLQGKHKLTDTELTLAIGAAVKAHQAIENEGFAEKRREAEERRRVAGEGRAVAGERRKEAAELRAIEAEKRAATAAEREAERWAAEKPIKEAAVEDIGIKRTEERERFRLYKENTESLIAERGKAKEPKTWTGPEWAREASRILQDRMMLNLGFDEKDFDKGILETQKVHQEYPELDPAEAVVYAFKRLAGEDISQYKKGDAGKAAQNLGQLPPLPPGKWSIVK